MKNSGSEVDLIYALVVTPDGLCFAARESGLYRSDDGGRIWQSAYEALKLKTVLSTTALTLSPVFAQDRTLFAGIPGGILRSTDGGQQWVGASLPDPPQIISALAVSPAYSKDGFLLATTPERGVFYSTDRGETWSTGNFALFDYHVLTLALSPNFAVDKTVLIGTESGVFSSMNGGRSWQVVDLPYVAVTSVAFAQNGIAYAGTDGDGLYTSPDKGIHWTRSTLEPTLSISLILTPATGELLVLADDVLYRSQDGGETWLTHKLSAPATAVVLLDAAALLIGFADGTISSVDLVD